jgi:hypothetical protein
MNIFIPVLIICLNGNCEFMQAKTYYKTQEQCKASMEMQKQHMRNLVKESGKSAAEVLEGTCIDAEIKTTPGRVS